MRALKTVRFLFALGVCLHVFALCAGGHLLFLFAVRAVTRPPVGHARDGLFAWQEFWTPTLLQLFCLLVGLRLAYALPAEAKRGPVIALANHRSWLDIFVLTGALHRLDSRRLMAVIKRSIANYPVLGWFALGIRCAVVTRKKAQREEDLQRIRACARHAREDEATVVIFPEGTRNTQAEERAVLDPKIGGLTAIMETLPERQVLVVVVKWPPGVRVRTLLEGATLVGATLPVEAVFVPRKDRTPSEVLSDAMNLMERRLTHT